MTIKSIVAENLEALETCPIGDRQGFLSQIFRTAGATIQHGVPVPYSCKVNLDGFAAYIHYGDPKIAVEQLGGKARGFKALEILEAIERFGSPEALTEALEIDATTLRRWDKRPLTKVIRLALSALR